MQHESGALLYDPATNKVGEYQDRSGPYALLRPVGGGREWQADPTAVRLATPAERMSAGVRAANQRPRTDGPFLVAVGPRPPVPMPDCAECEDLVTQRAAARAEHDYSAETDANVLLRRHQHQDHQDHLN
ncbi:hypothetical protein SAMN04487983_1022103 [Streptomyces sp. yr375]|uniref:hypothetical protein n=1 Tax=Streptomyces sp. yr375 TaxID=1761906 RepID=UPI0008C626D4|nr:hypothetical protein [Streptomyces sp. yr375]SER80353.1 hypothetical protein SAMN04487983_1022103 [Streptomyces sp. yr375]